MNEYNKKRYETDEVLKEKEKQHQKDIYQKKKI